MPAGEPTDYKRFIEIWMSSHCTQEVAEQMGLSKSAVISLGTRLRKKGVRLPRFKQSRVKVDVAALNKVVDANKEVLKKPRKAS